MNQSIAVRRPWEAVPGDVIVVHPERPETIRATVTGKPWSDGWYTRIPYRSGDVEGVFELEPKNAVVIEPAPERLLTDAERTEELDRLSEDEAGFMLAAITATDPTAFETALLALKRLPARLEDAR